MRRRNLQAIITVHYSDVSDIGGTLCVEDSELIIQPLHAEMEANMACYEDCLMFYKDMLETLEDERDLEILPNSLYATIFKVEIIYTEDYYGEVDSDWAFELIDHAKIGSFDEDNNLTYWDERVQYDFEMIELA